MPALKLAQLSCYPISSTLHSIGDLLYCPALRSDYGDPKIRMDRDGQATTVRGETEAVGDFPTSQRYHLP
jgi:hypothetical protein